MADYFVKVEDSRELRRSLLISSKECLHVLQRGREIQALRERKRTLMAQARRDLKELTFLLGELDKRLPVLTKKELQELMPRPPKAPVVKVKKGGKAKHAARGKSGKGATTESVAAPAISEQQMELMKLQRLEQALSMIEDRLNKL